MTTPYKVTIEGPGLTLVMQDVPKAVCDQITVLVLTGTAAPAPVQAGQQPLGNPGAAPAPSGPAGGPALSLREYLDAHEPKRLPDKITVIGMFLKDQENKETFSSPELESSFERASEPVPGNLSRDIKWTVKSGWIAPKADAKGRYYVTQTGRAAAQKKFPKELAKKSRLMGGARKSAKKSSGTQAT